MKLLLVSDIHHFSVYDVFKGYCDGFSKLQIRYEKADLAELARYYSLEMSWGLVMAKFLNAEENYTHALFVSGLIVPEWLLASKYNKKIGIISLDDPHAFKEIKNKVKYLDYCTTNEKTIADKYPDILYLPTATSTELPTVAKRDVPPEFRSNVVFIGTMYDNRIKPMEVVCEYCKEKDLNLKIYGPLLKTPRNSIIMKYAKNEIVSNREAKMMYRGSDIVINIDRNANWHPMESVGNPLMEDTGFVPYSTNPRIYEVAGCRTAQLFINPRQEAKDLFGENIFVCDEDKIKEGMDSILNGRKDDVLEKINNCFNIVREGHTYVNRASKLLNFIERKDLKKGK